MNIKKNHNRMGDHIHPISNSYTSEFAITSSTTLCLSYMPLIFYGWQHPISNSNTSEFAITSSSTALCLSLSYMPLIFNGWQIQFLKSSLPDVVTQLSRNLYNLSEKHEALNL